MFRYIIIGGVLLMCQTANAESLQPAPLIAPVQPITNELFGWDTHSVRATTEPLISLEGCPGEFIPASVLLFCPGPMKGLTLRAGVLMGPSAIPPRVLVRGEEVNTVDIRWVKRWWQTGLHFYDTSHPQFVPKLLLHDYDLVESQYDKPMYNKVKPDKELIDPPELQPASFPASQVGLTQQAWITVHIPHGTPPGIYRTVLTLESEIGAAARILLSLKVYPFELRPSALTHLMYYRARLRATTSEPNISHEGRVPTQMKADFWNMVRHGVTHATIYTPPTHLDRMIRIIGMFRGTGLHTDALYTLNSGVGGQVFGTKDYNLVGLQNSMRDGSKNFMPYFKRGWGVDKFLRVAVDESAPGQLRPQFPLWDASAEGGCPIFASLNLDVKIHGELMLEAAEHLDTMVYAVSRGFPPREFVDAVHERGCRILLYGPQTGSDQAEVYRRNVGIRAMASGVDGTAMYVWQQAFPWGTHPWDELASIGGNYRSHMFTYPTVDGCVDTLPYEGYAAGIIDCRYLTTLEAAIDECPNRHLARDAWQWLRGAYTEAETVDLDSMRRRCAEWIVKLEKVNQ